MNKSCADYAVLCCSIIKCSNVLLSENKTQMDHHTPRFLGYFPFWCTSVYHHSVSLFKCLSVYIVCQDWGADWSFIAEDLYNHGFSCFVGFYKEYFFHHCQRFALQTHNRTTLCSNHFWSENQLLVCKHAIEICISQIELKQHEIHLTM